MADRPIFVATHPRSCSTAFERVFMTRPDDLACAHEPFGDAFYYGPERLGTRFADDAAERERSGFAQTTYKHVLDRLLGADKRLFVKDMAYYLYAPDGQPTPVAPSLASLAGPASGGGAPAAADPHQPAVPLEALRRFHFAFLIRHPRRAIPSYYRCTVPPLVETTGFAEFLPAEAGYRELRRLFDFLRAHGVVGPGSAGAVPVAVLDADDLLDRPVEAIQAFCRAVRLDYRPEMLQWDDGAHQEHAATAFAKWAGFHNDALASNGLRPRTSPRKTPTAEEEDAEWRAKYGDEGQQIIRRCVDANTADYEYLKQFALQF